MESHESSYLFQKYDLSNAMAVVCRQEFLHFVVLKVLQAGEIIVVVYKIIKERRLIMLVATLCGLFSTIILPTRNARK